MLGSEYERTNGLRSHIVFCLDWSEMVTIALTRRRMSIIYLLSCHCEMSLELRNDGLVRMRYAR